MTTASKKRPKTRLPEPSRGAVADPRRRMAEIEKSPATSPTKNMPDEQSYARELKYSATNLRDQLWEIEAALHLIVNGIDSTKVGGGEVLNASRLLYRQLEAAANLADSVCMLAGGDAPP